MKKLLSGSYYFAILIGLIFTICGFLFAGNETSFRKGEVAGKQTITPQSVEQIDKMTKEYIFSGDDFRQENVTLVFYSIHLRVAVYEDGEKIYEVKPVSSVFGKTPGSLWNFIEIRPDCDQVVVRTEAVYQRVSSETLSFYIGESVNEVLSLIRGSAC